MAKFPQKTLHGIAYDLGHLDPMPMQVTYQARTLQTLVNFSCHCFTEKFTANKHTADHSYRYNGEHRAFDVDRHALSLGLPQHFATLGNQTVYHSQNESFFFIRSVNNLGVNVPYVVFFRSYKSTLENQDVYIDVSSAYLKPGMTSWASPVKFPTMVNARANNARLPLGPKMKIKRA